MLVRYGRVLVIIAALVAAATACGSGCGGPRSAVPVVEGPDAAVPMDAGWDGGEVAGADAGWVQYPNWKDGGLRLTFESIEPLGVPGKRTRALFINERGTVVGVQGGFDGGPFEYGYVWRDGGLTDLGQCVEEVLNALAEDDVIAARPGVNPCLGRTQEFLLPPDGGMEWVPYPLSVKDLASGHGILTIGGGRSPLILEADGGQRMLEKPDGSYEFGALAIADNRRVVGTAATLNGWEAAVWETDGGIHYLPGRGWSSEAVDVTSSGFVAGIVSNGSRSISAIWYGEDRVDIFPDPPQTFGGGIAVTEDGLLLAMDLRRDPVTQMDSIEPFIWGGGEKVYLNSLLPPDAGVHILSAADLNSKGHVVGVAQFGDESRGFLLKLRRE